MYRFLPKRVTIVNSKHEIRNSKQAQIIEIQISQTESLGFRTFGFVSDFDIRISDLAKEEEVERN